MSKRSDASENTMKDRDDDKARGIRQTMSDLHIWVGLLAGWILYAMFLTGTVSYFKDELSQWMRPEMPHQKETLDPALVAQRSVDELSTIAAGSPQWSMRIPDSRTNTVDMFWRIAAPPGEGQRRGRGQRPEGAADGKGEAKGEAKSDARTEGSSTAKGDAKSEAKADGATVAMADAGTPRRSRGEGKGRTEAGEARSEAAKSDGSTEPKSDAPKGDAKADAKGDAKSQAPAQPQRRAFQSVNLDPETGKKVSARDTLGGNFFYRFHFQLHYMPVAWGRWIAGICAMFMLIAIVSGVITHKKIFIDFFTFRWGKGQRSWLDAHNVLSVFGLPFHLMITYTGLVTLMAMYMPWGSDAAFKNPAERQQLNAQLSAFIQPIRPTGEKVALAPMEPMVRQAQALWGRDNVDRVTIANPGDANARVAIVRGEANRANMSPQYLLFEGTTGKLLEKRDSVGPAAETRGVLYALHLGRFSDTELRWLYFIVSLAGTAMVGTGLVMWTVKRRQKLADPQKPYFGFRLVERLNIASIAGLSVAMTAYLWGNRLLPVEMVERGNWEVHFFFAVWALMLVHASLRPAKAAWIEQLWAATILLALLPVLNMFTTTRPLWTSIAQGDWVFIGMDLMFWALAALHAVLAIRTTRHKPKVKPVKRPRAEAATVAAGSAEAAPATARLNEGAA